MPQAGQGPEGSEPAGAHGEAAIWLPTLKLVVTLISSRTSEMSPSSHLLKHLPCSPPPAPSLCLFSPLHASSLPPVHPSPAHQSPSLAFLLASRLLPFLSPLVPTSPLLCLPSPLFPFAPTRTLRPDTSCTVRPGPHLTNLEKRGTGNLAGTAGASFSSSSRFVNERTKNGELTPRVTPPDSWWVASGCLLGLHSTALGRGGRETRAMNHCAQENVPWGPRGQASPAGVRRPPSSPRQEATKGRETRVRSRPERTAASTPRGPGKGTRGVLREIRQRKR